jgi:hypothetical protein
MQTLENLPSPGILATVNQYIKSRDLSLVPTAIFRCRIESTLFKTVRPPTRKHLGTRLRTIDALPTLPKIYQEMLATGRGLPTQSPGEELQRVPRPGLPQRLEDMPIKPYKESATLRRYKVKLMRQDAIASLCSFEKSNPSLGFGPLRLILKRIGPKKYEIKKIAMAASPFTFAMREPLGKSAQERFATITAKLNVLTMDPATLEIHFGVTNYEPWTKKWLRWEMYSLIESMAMQPNLKVPISTELLEEIAIAKANTKLARQPKWEELQ